MTVLPGRLAAVAALALVAGLGTAPAALAASADPCAVYPGTCAPPEEPVDGVDEPVDVDPPDSGVDSDTGGDDPDEGTGTGGPASGVGGTSGGTGGSLDAAPESLPLTGGEATLLALGGLAAVGTGTALVVASRRRAQTA